MAKDRALFISDLQIPFEAPGALAFVKAVARDFRIPIRSDNTRCSAIFNVGDETDQYHGSLYPKTPENEHTANQEIAITRRKIRDWGAAFPEMKLAISNHGIRWAKKAEKAEIPSQLLRSYQDIFDMPPGWKWKHTWEIKMRKKKILLMHGMGYGGMYAYRHAPLDLGCSVVFGHLHSSAGIAHLRTANQAIFGMNVGCLIDPEAYAFQYSKHNRHKPWLGVGVVVDGGLTPILVPYERF